MKYRIHMIDFSNGEVELKNPKRFLIEYKRHWWNRWQFVRDGVDGGVFAYADEDPDRRDREIKKILVERTLHIFDDVFIDEINADKSKWNKLRNIFKEELES